MHSKKQKPIYQVCRNVFAIMMLFVVSNDKKCWMITCHMILHQLPRNGCEKNLDLPKNNTTTLKRSLWNVSNDAVSDAVYWIKLFWQAQLKWKSNTPIQYLIGVLQKFKVLLCQEKVISFWKKNPLFER